MRSVRTLDEIRSEETCWSISASNAREMAFLAGARLRVKTEICSSYGEVELSSDFAMAESGVRVAS